MDARYCPRFRTTGAVLLGLSLSTVSCREVGDPTAPHVQADVTAGGPTITGVVPDSSIRGVTLDITVDGSGFDPGAVVGLERQGTPGAGITTNSTTFVNSRRLIANITIAADADPGKYDVAVTTSRGRKGVGIELFAVEYEISELGILGGTWSRAHAINEQGEVVGASCTRDCLSTAFYWSKATGQVDLGGLPGYTRSGAYAINSRGQVFGAAQCWAGDAACGGVFKTTMVRWDKVGESWTITPLEGCSLARPLADDTEKFLINNNDQCVKRLSRSLVVQTISGASVVDEVTLPSLYADGSDVANAISDAPMVAGASYEVLERLSEGSARLGPPQPVVWYRHASDTWVTLRLGFPSTDSRAWATDIGNPDASGRVRVAGYTEQWGATRHLHAIRAVRWTLEADGSGGWKVASTEVLESGGRKGQAAHAWAKAVNDAGDIVGTAGAFLETGSPVKWPISSGIAMLPVGHGGVQGRAMDINNQGWVVGAIWDNSDNCDRAAVWQLW